jgi:serine/threonine protein kinase
MEQLLLTIDFLQKKNLVHRDIKLDNILISKIEDEDKFNVKLGDFGLTTFLKEGDKLSKLCGSPSYIAPEILMKLPYDFKSDIFSAGSVFYNLLTGLYLFNGESTDSILIANRDCDLTSILVHLSGLSQDCRDLLLSMLNPNPSERPSAY